MLKQFFSNVSILLCLIFIECICSSFLPTETRVVENFSSPTLQKSVVVKEVQNQNQKTFVNEDSTLISAFDSIGLNKNGLSRSAFNLAIKGFQTLKNRGKLLRQNIITIIDYSKPSSEKRLFVIDFARMKLLYNTYVAHGQGSGLGVPKFFSNRPESLQSSLGFS